MSYTPFSNSSALPCRLPLRSKVGIHTAAFSRRQFKPSQIGLACLVLVSLTGTAFAAPIVFSQVPAGNGGRPPAPNVIVTVDDSGSMAWDVTTDNVTSTAANRKINLLKSALKNTFGNGTSNSGTIPDGRIRLAWQAMHNNGNASGAASLTPGGTNSIKSFTGTHRSNFNTFVDSLSASGGTPSLNMMANVYDYMRTAQGTNNPWADNPGTSQSTSYLACRRTYHVFMTDGAWNGQSNTNNRVSKGDSVTQTLGDGTTVYDTTSDQVKVYKDNFGDTKTTKASTLSDYAFRNWATDLQDGTGGTQAMANTVAPLGSAADFEPVWGTPPPSTTTPCTNANDCTLLQKFWNPKTDPATWQHVTQYTIGFGLGAVSWPVQTADGTLIPNPTRDLATRATPQDWGTNGTSADMYAGDYAQLVRGKYTWPDVYSDDTSPSGNQQNQRTVELWHAAINGRGKYYPAKTATALDQAFSDILGGVLRDTEKPLISIATSSSYLRTGLDAYIAGYNALNYAGSLAARPISGTTGAIGATETWNAATLLDAISTANLSNRFVLSYGLDPATSTTKGISWATYSTLPTLHQTPLSKNSSGAVDHTTANNLGQKRLDYLRGDRSNEVATGGVFRDRGTRLGDIVNSNIWYTGKPASGYTTNGYATFRSTGTGGQGGRTPMVYVGANDGMLHGFAAGNWPSDTSTTIAGGTERLAYIPQGVAQGKLRNLTDSTYSHLYYVDGTPFTGDAYIGSPSAWKTVLVGTLGAGGKGYFVLDVTDPALFIPANAANLVLAETTASSDADIGFIFSAPVMDDAVSNKSRQIVKMNGGRWAAVLGNGYNSTNEAPVLLIQYLDGDKSIKKLSPCGIPVSNSCSASFKGSNGLSAPQLIDINGDGTIDIAYAGDLKGNLWKFDLTSATDSAWKVSFSNQPLFAAKRSATITQPFTTAPLWAPHPEGGIMLAVGTGMNLTDADQATTSTESLYALYDNSTFTISGGIITLTDTTPINTTSATGLPATLVQQTMTSVPLPDSGTNYFTTSNNPVDYAGNPTATPPVAAKRGWYLDFPLAGQRVLQNIRAFSGQKIMVQSMIPKTGSTSNAESCSASSTTERSFQSVLNLFSGNPPATPTFAFVNTTTFTTPIALNVTTIEGVAGDNTLIRTDDKIKLLSSNCPTGQVCNAKDFNPGTFIGARANWRQVK
jgi:type IV pilus assembly protein PilY1